MVVTHLHVVGVVVIAPHKANTVLVVNPYAVLASPVTFERFKAVARRKSEVVQNLGSIHHFQLSAGSAFYFSETLYGLTVKEVLSLFISKGLDHTIVYSAIGHNARRT
jgi:hypothetical protein